MFCRSLSHPPPYLIVLYLIGLSLTSSTDTHIICNINIVTHNFKTGVWFKRCFAVYINCAKPYNIDIHNNDIWSVILRLQCSSTCGLLCSWNARRSVHEPVVWSLLCRRIGWSSGDVILPHAHTVAQGISQEMIKRVKIYRTGSVVLPQCNLVESGDIFPRPGWK